MPKNTVFVSFTTLLLTLVLAPVHTYPPSHSPKLHNQLTSNILANQGKNKVNILSKLKETPVTYGLIATTLLCSVLAYCFESTLKQHFTLSSNRWHTYIMSMFYEKNIIELSTNIFYMYMWGRCIETYYRAGWGNTQGSLLYLLLYLLAGISGSLLSLPSNYPQLSSVQISSTTSAVCATFTLFWATIGDQPIMLFLYPSILLIHLYKAYTNDINMIYVFYCFVPELLATCLTIIICPQIRQKLYEYCFKKSKEKAYSDFDSYEVGHATSPITLGGNNHKQKNMYFEMLKKTPVTYGLIATILLCSVLVYFKSSLTHHFAPSSSEWYTYITSIFYAQNLYLAMAVLLLYVAGCNVEASYRELWGNTQGSLLYLLLYLLAGISTKLLLPTHTIQVPLAFLTINAISSAHLVIINSKKMDWEATIPVVLLLLAKVIYIVKTYDMATYPLYLFVPDLIGICFTIIIHPHLRRRLYDYCFKESKVQAQTSIHFQ